MGKATKAAAARRHRRQAIIKTAAFTLFTACIIAAGILIAQDLTDKTTTPQKATESIGQQEPDPDPPEATSETTEAQSDTQSEPAPEPTYTYYDIPLADELQKYTQDLCREYGVSYELTLALMSAETDYRTNIISKTSDYGIMQINAVNHERLTEALGVTDYLDPEQNIRAGIYMLSEIAENYDTPQEILMVYNRGHAGAKKLWKQGITTTKYTNRVLERMKTLERR